MSTNLLLEDKTLQGVPLVDLEVEDFMRPITEHVRANFLTARALPAGI